MNKTELILSISEKAGISRKDAEKALNAAVETITEALAREEKVQIVGFGSFETKFRPERLGRNPRTKEDVVIPASKAPAFKAGKALKDAVNH
jgi:DNA-binding protein HU-beta